MDKKLIWSFFETSGDIDLYLEYKNLIENENFKKEPLSKDAEQKASFKL